MANSERPAFLSEIDIDPCVQAASLFPLHHDQPPATRADIDGDPCTLTVSIKPADLEIDNEASSAIEIDGLFRASKVYCRQHDRQQTDHRYEHAVLLQHADRLQDALRLVRARNDELRALCSRLQATLERERTKNTELANRAPDAVGGNSHPADPTVETAADSSLSPQRRRSSTGSRSSGTKKSRNRRAEAKEPPNWRAIQHRLPRSRHQSVWAMLQEKLLSAGLDLEGSASPNFDCAAGGISRRGRGSGDPRAVASTQERPSKWTCRGRIQAHNAAVRCVAYQEGTLLTGAEDQLIKIWDVACASQGETQANTISYRGHGTSVVSLTCSDDLAQFFSASDDGEIRVWSRQQDSPYPPTTVVGTRHPAVCRSRLLGHQDSVWDLCLHPFCAVPQARILASAGADNVVMLWDAFLPSEQDPSPATSDGPMPWYPFSSPKMAIWLPCGSTTTTTTAPSQVESPVSLAWSRFGEAPMLIGYARRGVAAFDVETKQITQFMDKLWTAPEVPSIGAGVASSWAGFLSSLDCHENSNVFAAGVGGKAVVVDMVSGSAAQNFTGHPDAVTSVAFEPSNGHEVLTGCLDGTVRVFDSRNGLCLQSIELRGHCAAAGPVHGITRAGCHCIAIASACGNIFMLGKGS